MIELWVPPVVWAALIALASTRHFSCANTSGFFARYAHNLFSRNPAKRFTTLHILVRKLTHWFGYFVLTLLLARAVHYQFADSSELAQLGGVFLAVSIIAAMDELHQSTVPTRHGNLTDVMIDIFGSACAILLLLIPS